MPIPTLITDLSTTAASNYPAGSDSPSVLDDVQRAHASFIAKLRDESAKTVDLAASSGSSLIGHLPAGAGAVATTVQDKLREQVSLRDFGIIGDGVTDHYVAIRAALQEAATTGVTLFVNDGVYLCSQWIPLPANLKLRFDSNAWWKLTGNTALGGFVCGGYTSTLGAATFQDVDVHDMKLDCNNISGENGINAVRCTGNVRFFNPVVKNTRHDPVTLGGRAFQFEGPDIDGISIYSPLIYDCSIGINQQADSFAGTEKTRNINYFDVVMRNVDVPFNIDGQFASPELGTSENANVTVHSASLYNCGKLTWPGNLGALGGGIICGDRGRGLHIAAMRIENDVSYGGIGALVHGVMFGVTIGSVVMTLGGGATCLFDFGQVGFGFPSASTFASTVSTNSVRCLSNLDFVVKGGGAAGRIGASKFAGIELDDSVATLSGVVDANAGLATTAVLELIQTNNVFKTSGLRQLSNIYLAGNTIGICQPDYEEGSWTPIDASGAGLSFTVAGTPWYVRIGRLVTASCSITYPATANASNAVIGGLPFAAANFSPMGGVGAIGYTTEATLANIYIITPTTTSQLTTAAGTPITNATLSGDNVRISYTYIA